MARKLSGIRTFQTTLRYFIIIPPKPTLLGPIRRQARTQTQSALVIQKQRNINGGPPNISLLFSLSRSISLFVSLLGGLLVSFFLSLEGLRTTQIVRLGFSVLGSPLCAPHPPGPHPPGSHLFWVWPLHWTPLFLCLGPDPPTTSCWMNVFLDETAFGWNVFGRTIG